MENNRSIVLPENSESLMQAPNLAPGMDTHKGIVHEMAHIIVGDELGMKFSDGIQSHLHPEAKKTGAAMVAPIDWTPFLDEYGDINPEEMKLRMAEIAATYVAGGVANDLYHDIPFAENPHVGADMRILNGYMRQLEFADTEAANLIAIALDDAAQVLSQPRVRDVIEQHASVREAGLDEQHHVSQKRMEQILQDVTNRNQRTDEKAA